MISPDFAFVLVAGLAFLGFVLDALFDRLRLTSILPLMLLGIALVYFHVLPGGTLQGLNALVPYVSALTVAFILFHVGLGIRFEDLSRVVGRAVAFTFTVQVATGLAIAFVAWATLHWSPLVSLIFGFALSGPSSVSVPVLVRVARLSESLRTTLLFESVLSDLLQLLVPLFLIGLLVSGDFTPVHVSGVLVTALVGSALAGVVAAVGWLWVLDRIGAVAAEYSWTLTITMVLATYGIADYLGASPAITIFVFGLLIGNRRHLQFDPFARSGEPRSRTSRTVAVLREWLSLSSKAVDVDHIQQVQKEVSFFASAFFFVYIGLLFQTGGLTPLLLAVPTLATFVMLAVRLAGAPLLAPYLAAGERARRSERALVAFNIPRGLAAAVVATIPLARGVVIPGFLDEMFLGILLSTIVSTVGILLFYRKEPEGQAGGPSTSGTALPPRPALPSYAPGGESSEKAVRRVPDPFRGS